MLKYSLVCGPLEVDGVRLDVCHRELPDLECRRENGALESAAATHGLVGVQGRVGRLAENLLDESLDGGHAGTAANNLNRVNVILNRRKGLVKTPN